MTVNTFTEANQQICKVEQELEISLSLSHIPGDHNLPIIQILLCFKLLLKYFYLLVMLLAALCEAVSGLETYRRFLAHLEPSLFTSTSPHHSYLLLNVVVWLLFILLSFVLTFVSNEHLHCPHLPGLSDYCQALFPTQRLIFSECGQ